MPDIYVKNRFVDEQDALVHVSERGFRFGDGVFETICVHEGTPYQWEWHMQRLARGLAVLKIDFDLHTLKPLCDELLARNALRFGSLRIYISRGQGGRGYAPDKNATPLLVIETRLTDTKEPKPLSLWLSPSPKPSLKSLPVDCKIAQGLHATLSIIQAQEHGGAQALLLDEHGMLCEASSANLFWLSQDRLFTPALSTGALDGSTRAAIMRLSPWPVLEVEAQPAALEKAQAVCISHTGFPVAAVDELKPLGWRWQSEELARTLRELILRDRDAQAKAALKNINP